MADLRAYAHEAAARNGIDGDNFERQIDQESGFNPAAHNNASGADGLAQIVVRWHPAMAGKTGDPYASLDYAAGLMRNHLAVYAGDWALALSAYNAGPGATAQGLAGKLDGWPYPETVRYVTNILRISEADARARLTGRKSMTVTFNPDYPAVLQNDGWSCAPTSLTWAMRALGRAPGDDWIESDMVALNIVSHDQGLLDHTGQGIVNWLQINDPQHYGPDGYGISNATCPISWDQLIPEINPRPPYPLLLGLPQWGLAPSTGHWSGVRGYDPARGVILLANPDTGATYGQTTLTRQQFEARAANDATVVRVLHPDLLGVAAPPPVPVPPAIATVTRADLDAALAPLLALRERLTA